jgi:hypothetical protein
LGAAWQDGRTTRGQEQAVASERARVDELEVKLAKKDAIIAFIAAEHLALKKTLGES